MAYDEDLAERVRLAMAAVPDLVERKMFGGLAFMAGDHMACGVARDQLMLRLGPELAAKALERPHVRRMDMTGTPMRSVVLVGPAGVRDDAALQGWVDEAVAFVATLPPKKRRPLDRMDRRRLRFAGRRPAHSVSRA